MLDVAEIKRTADGQWRDIFVRTCGVAGELLDGKHHPCPKCGGTDRFRMIDAERGALFCNQCFDTRNGDGIAAVMWLLGVAFPEAIKMVADAIGLNVEAWSPDRVEEMAWRKLVGSNALRAFGAEVADRNGTAVCRVPMYDADMNVTGHFDMAPDTAALQKGLTTKGSKHGMFVVHKPTEGTEVCIVEGVKDAAALHGLGYQSVGLPTCRMDGRFARFFRGCRVVIVPDRDKAGSEGAEETAGRLFGEAASVKIAQLPTEYHETNGADVRDVLATRDGAAKVSETIVHAKVWGLQVVRSVRTIRFAVLSEAVNRLLEQDDPKANLVALGLPEVDDALDGGVLPGEMVIVAGRPSHGKTMVALQSLDSLSLDMPTLMVSTEMSVAALAQRIIAGVTSVSCRDWHQRRERVREDVAAHFARRKPCYVAETGGTAEDVVRAIGEAKQKHSIGAVAVDYVQMIRGAGNSRYEQVSNVSTSLKQAAVVNDVVLLAVCQLNRGIEGRRSTGPRMSDLRDSGQLEQDADVIIFVEWLHRTAPDEFKPNEFRLLIAKNRNRRIVRSRIDCLFIAEQQRLFPIARQEATEWTPNSKDEWWE